LFVDCDDTLEFYCVGSMCTHNGMHPYGSDGVANERLIEEIKRWRRDNPNALFVVWSGGGGWYARHFAERYFPRERFACLDKFGCNLEIPGPDDIVIDDMPIVTAAPVQNPREWMYEDPS
jgi:hypothetical protein